MNDAIPLTRISAHGRLSPLRELPRYAGLLYFLVWRDVKVRYNQTALGIAWVVLQPAGLILAATVALSRVVRNVSADVPYPLLVATGMVPWLFFSRAVSDSSDSIVRNERLVTKVYFPRVLLPIGSVLGVAMDAIIGMTLIVVALVVSGIPFRPQWLLVPIPLLFVLAAAFGFGAGIAALTVRYRDARHVVPFLLQFAFLLTPVVYPTRVVPEKWRLLISLNPMTGATDAIRWCFFGGQLPETLLLSAISTLVVATLGWLYFRSGEDVFADVV